MTVEVKSNIRTQMKYCTVYKRICFRQKNEMKFDIYVSILHLMKWEKLNMACF